MPICSVICPFAYFQMQLRKSAMTSTASFPCGRGGSRGSGLPVRTVSADRYSLNHSHL